MDKRVEEHCSFLAVLAGGEDLLELVDDERDSLSRLEARDGLAETRRAEHARELRTRVLARPHEQHPPPSASGQGSFRQRRHEPGAEDRRLTAARGADDADERSAREPGDEVGDDLLPAVEVVRVADIEEREPLKRADDDADPIRLGAGGGPSRAQRAAEAGNPRGATNLANRLRTVDAGVLAVPLRDERLERDVAVKLIEPPAVDVEVEDDVVAAGCKHPCGIPEAERALLPLLVRGGELIPLILNTLKDEWLSDEGVKRVVTAYRHLDFQGQIPHLSEDSDNKLLARADLEEGPEPSPARVHQVLRVLETEYLEHRGKVLQEEIQRAEAEQRPWEELAREKQEIGRRIQELKPSRKGKALAD